MYANAKLLQLPDRSSIVPGSDAGHGSFSKCVDECKIFVDCIAITYKGNTSQCSFLTIDPAYAWLSYQLMYADGYTHAAKVGTEGKTH